MQELKEKVLDAELLLEMQPSLFSQGTDAGRLVQDIIASVEQQVCRRVRTLKGKDAAAAEPLVLAIAVLTKVEKELNPKAVMQVAEDEAVAEPQQPVSEPATSPPTPNGKLVSEAA